MGEEEKHDVQFSYKDQTQLIFNEDDGEDFGLYCNPCIINLVPHKVTSEAAFDDVDDSSDLRILSINDGEDPKSITFTLFTFINTASGVAFKTSKSISLWKCKLLIFLLFLITSEKIT